MIAGELRRYLRDIGPLRVSRSIRDTAYKVLQCKEALLREKGREPTLDGDRPAVGAAAGGGDRVHGRYGTARSRLYEPVYSDGGDPLTVMDQVRDTKNTDEQLDGAHRPATGDWRSCADREEPHSGAALL